MQKLDEGHNDLSELKIILISIQLFNYFILITNTDLFIHSLFLSKKIH